MIHTVFYSSSFSIIDMAEPTLQSAPVRQKKENVPMPPEGWRILDSYTVSHVSEFMARIEKTVQGNNPKFQWTLPQAVGFLYTVRDGLQSRMPQGPFASEIMKAVDTLAREFDMPENAPRKEFEKAPKTNHAGARIDQAIQRLEAIAIHAGGTPIEEVSARAAFAQMEQWWESQSTPAKPIQLTPIRYTPINIFAGREGEILNHLPGISAQMAALANDAYGTQHRQLNLEQVIGFLRMVWVYSSGNALPPGSPLNAYVQRASNKLAENFQTTESLLKELRNVVTQLEAILVTDSPQRQYANLYVDSSLDDLERAFIVRDNAQRGRDSDGSRILH